MGEYSKRIDMTGKQIGKLTVLEPVKKSNQPKIVYWRCKCECGKLIEIRAGVLRRGAQSCGCERSDTLHKLKWKGYGEIGRCYWNRLRSGAKARNLDFNISIEDGWNLFLEQKRKCGLTGLPLTFATDVKRQKQQQTASLDRIDNTQGYIKSNIMWVHKHVNKLKATHDIKHLIYWCKMIADNNQC